MTTSHLPIRTSLLGAASLSLTVALGACGGGGDAQSVSATPAVASAPTTAVTTSVIDGPIKNAVVCIDRNGNGQCDADETQGTTDAAGSVTLAVPNADVGKYAILAVVGKDAVDTDHGPVPVAYTMSAPADRTAVVSPLTTLVQQTVSATGASTADAAKTVQVTTGITTSLFEDFTKVVARDDGSLAAATVARMIVVATQQQATAVASAVNTPAIDGAKITQADLDKAVQRKLLELLPALIVALSDPALQSATGSAREAALVAAATAVVGDSGLSPASAATVVAINKAAESTTASPTTFDAAVTLIGLNYTSASSYYARMITFSAAQATPDANNMIRFVDRRLSSSGGALAKWGSGSSPARGADMHWNGKVWSACPINFENTAKVRDAAGNGASDFCDQVSVDISTRATIAVGGKTLADVYAQARAAGYTNLFVADVAFLGSATFPTGSSVFYQSNTPLSTAITYYPGGANSPVGTGNIASQYSAAVAAGGNAGSQPTDAACNAPETNASTASIAANTLETWIAAKRGTPCVYVQGSLTYNGSTYLGDTANEWWGNSVASIDKIGTAPVFPGAASTGYYTGNTLLRLAFPAAGTNAVTYLACKERFYNGSTRNCSKLGDGTYTITTLGDARVLSLNNPPAQVAALSYSKVWVERGGFVYAGYRTKPVVSNTVRLNTIAATAMLQQLGIPIENPEVPLALTATSYQGTWDLRHAADPVSAIKGTTVSLFASGGAQCYDKASSRYYDCTVTITDPATGAFSYIDATGTASGRFDHLAGTVTGSYSDPTANPSTGSISGGRR